MEGGEAQRDPPRDAVKEVGSPERHSPGGGQAAPRAPGGEGSLSPRQGGKEGVPLALPMNTGPVARGVCVMPLGRVCLSPRRGNLSVT